MGETFLSMIRRSLSNICIEMFVLSHASADGRTLLFSGMILGQWVISGVLFLSGDVGSDPWSVFFVVQEPTYVLSVRNAGGFQFHRLVRTRTRLLKGCYRHD